LLKYSQTNFELVSSIKTKLWQQNKLEIAFTPNLKCIKNNEGHGFHNQNNQYDFYGAMEKFLAKYLNPEKVEQTK
jgi:hypothetical protein